MSLFRHISLGLRALRGRGQPEDDVDEEVRDFFERARAELVRQGFSREEASRAGRRGGGVMCRACADVRE